MAYKQRPWYISDFFVQGVYPVAILLLWLKWDWVAWVIKNILRGLAAIKG